MIVCPNCSHQNPDGAQACEACFTPLPATTTCPHCGAPIQADASFCGQCGSNLKPANEPDVAQKPAATPLPDLPDLVTPDPFGQPATQSTSLPDPLSPSVVPATVVGQPPAYEPATATPPATVAGPFHAKTQLQQQTARLLHAQTNTIIELPQNLSVVHMGKPNDQIPPDVDVSGFPNSEIVSRIHADIRVEGDNYYIEDVGSSNGTYINHNPLLPGNRHRLRPGDRISLGKGDKVTFLFQLS